MTTAKLRMRYQGSVPSVPFDNGKVIEVRDGVAFVPYNMVRLAIDKGFSVDDQSMPWPPRPGWMSPSEQALAWIGNVDDLKAIEMPDGSFVPVPRPFHNAIEIPLQFVPHFQALGWVRLDTFA